MERVCSLAQVLCGGCGVVYCLLCCTVLKGVGLAMAGLSFLSSLSHSVLLAWSLVLLVR